MHAQVVVYKKSVLVEEDDNCLTNVEPANCEIISINASPTTQSVPIPPNALIANHFGLSGGTDTGMTAESFESALRQSVEFWHDKAMCGN